MDDCKHASIVEDVNDCLKCVDCGMVVALSADRWKGLLCLPARESREATTRDVDMQETPYDAQPSELVVSADDDAWKHLVVSGAPEWIPAMDISDASFSEDTIARCVDVLIAEPFSMREDRAVEVARAVLKAALKL